MKFANIVQTCTRADWTGRKNRSSGTRTLPGQATASEDLVDFWNLHTTKAHEKELGSHNPHARLRGEEAMNSYH